MEFTSIPSEIEVIYTKIGEMAAKIAYYNYEWRFDTLVVFNLMHLAAIKAFLANYDQAIIIKKGKHLPPQRVIRPPARQFVIFGQDADDISDILQWLIQSKYDNTAKYIILCSSSDELKCDEQMIFQTIFDVSIANVVFLKVSGDQPIAYSYYPVLPQKCWNAEPKKIDISYDCFNDSCFKFLYPEKFDNLYQCPLIISTFEQPPYMYLYNGTAEPSGGDGDILRIVVSMLNATLVIKTPIEGLDWGHYTNNNWTGSLGDVYNGRAQGSMCSAPLTQYKYGNFQISFTYNSMDMVWAARLPDVKPSWEKLLNPIGTCMRIVLLFMFIAVAFMNTFTKTNIWKNITIVRDIALPKTNLLFYSWALFIGMPIQRMPSKISNRIMIITWIWFCIIIRSVYQGALIGSLKLQAYQNRLMTFNDVLVNRYPFGGLLTLREYYSEDRRIYDNWQSVNLADTYKTLDEMSAKGSDFVIALNKETVIEHLLKYNGTRKLQIIPEKIVNSPTVIYFRKYSHLTFPISRYLTVILEGGFSQRLYMRYVKHVAALTQQLDTQQSGALRLEHFTGCIVVLILGWVLCIIYFSVEVFCGRMMTSQ